MNTVALGDFNSLVVQPLAAFRYVINQKADYAILAHNHPNGIVTPTPEDIDTTDLLFQFGKMINIPVRDKLIISLDNYCSFAEEKIIYEYNKSYRYAVPYMIKRDALDEGRKEGIAAGKMLGLVEGELVGIDKGEKNKAVDMAKSMLADNMDIEIIAKHTKLTIEEIEKIKKDMGL